eukprot:6527786-Pyramimonas_sp.AAC.1
MDAVGACERRHLGLLMVGAARAARACRGVDLHPARGRMGVVLRTSSQAAVGRGGRSAPPLAV